MQTSIAGDVAAVGRLSAVPKILEAVAHLTGLRFAVVARVTDSNWTACAVFDQIDFGLNAGGELPLETTLCNEIRDHHQPVVFGQASADPHYASHPIPKLYGFESYISIPIFRTSGEFFGTLCALDPLPAKLDDPNIVRTLELFAQLIAAQLEIEERLERADNALLAAHDLAKLREQFIAVLGHDLRSPLQALSIGTELLTQASDDPAWQRHLKRMQRSCQRMNELIHDILDFARGRLGGGIPLDIRTGAELEEKLLQVIAEVQAVNADRSISAEIVLPRPVRCDDRRLAQMLGNLLSNAVAHGSAERPVEVRARSDETSFELSVSNGGEAIPEAIRSRLFEPFWRANSEQPSGGLGLGLYIAAEIARAHGGTIEVDSSADSGTVFVFRMPLGD
ncbi:MAG: GAF domain-containing sensor histidine kinase [Arenimonas sp.]